LKLNLRF